MVTKLPNTPGLVAAPTRPDPITLRLWAVNITRNLFTLFTNVHQRLNNSLPSDGTERMEAPLPLQSILTAARPVASTATIGVIVYVSDASAGDEFQVSDGVNWFPITLGGAL